MDRDTFWTQIDALAQRMNARLQELTKRDKPAQLRGQLTRLAERHRQLRLRFEAARGPDWDSSEHELSREHGDLFKEFVKFEEKLDKSERMHPDRTSGAKSGLG